MFYSLRTRLIIMFSLLLIIPLTIIVAVVIGVSTDVIGQLIRVSTSQTMNQYATYVSSMTEQAEEMANQVLANDITQDWLTTQKERLAASLTDFQDNMKMQQYLSMLSSNNSKIESVSVYFNDRYGIWTFSDDYLKSPWYTSYIVDDLRWTPSHYDKEQPSISMKTLPLNSYIHPLTELQTMQNIGLIKVNISTKEIRRPLDSIRLGDTGHIYLVQGNGEPILDQDMADHLGIVKAGLKQIEATKTDDISGYTRVSEGNKSYLLFYHRLEPLNWMLTGVVSEDELFNRITSIRTYVFLFSGVLLALAIAGAYWMSSGIVSPLSKLASSMRFVENGDFLNAAKRLPDMKSKKNEVSFVVQIFSRMIHRLRDNIQLEVELNLRRKDAEYKALLLQINPHFLYNTLEVIGSLSAQGRNKDVLKVTESLGRMMRYSLRLDNDIVNLKEELKYVNYFASIISMVYGERMSLLLLDETGEEEASIPKFILQPLVENAVKFSLDHTEKVEIVLIASLQGNDLSISVRDNGIGMKEELLQELLAVSIENDDYMLNNNGKRIGLRNVIARGRLIYGDRFHINIDSNPGAGTTVNLSFPRGGEHYISGHDRR